VLKRKKLGQNMGHGNGVFVFLHNRNKFEYSICVWIYFTILNTCTVYLKMNNICFGTF